MDENFNNLNNNEINNNGGQISGFDSAVSENSVETETENQVNSGFYTKTGNDIIQDEPAGSSINNAKAEQEANANTSYNSGYSYNPNNNYKNYNTYTPPKTNYYNPYQNRKTPNQKKKYSFATVMVATVLAAVIGAASGIGALIYFNGFLSKGQNGVGNNTPSQNVNINIDKTVESVVEAVSEKVSPSVVGIRTTTSVFNFFGGSDEATGEGSGVIYSEDGYIITNYHVIESVAESSRDAKIEVFLNNSTDKSYEASIVGYHISSDLAVIKINATGLPAVTVADSDKLNKGQYVIAIGSPGGLEFMGSVTYGVISGLERVVSSNSGITLIQTDAAINPGNSGGALLNTNGELVGINSSKIVSEEFEGMGFAIPSNIVVEKCKQIIERKDMAEPYVGITISERYTPDVLNYLGFPVGAVVLRVDEDSPAQAAKIRKGDIITEFDGKTVSNYKIFNEYLHDSKPNSKVTVKLYRSGKYYTTEITIGSNNGVQK